MKNKILYIILTLLLIISIVLNVYQYQSINTLKSQYTTLQSSIDDLQTEKQSLDSTLSDKDAEINTLTATIDDLQSQLETLQSDNEDLSSQIDDLQATINEQEESAYLAESLPVKQETSTAGSTSESSSSQSSETASSSSGSEQSSSGDRTTVDNSTGLVMGSWNNITFGGQATAEGGSGTVLNFQ